MCSIKEAVLKNFAIFTGKQLCLKRLQHSCFPKHITNFYLFWKTSANGCFWLFFYFSNLFVFDCLFTIIKKNYDLLWWRKFLLKLGYGIQWHDFKVHVKIVEIYMVKFNVSIWNRLKIMELFVNAKWIIHKYNAILNKTVTKLFTILTKCFFPYLNPTSYFNLSFSSGVFPSILKIATVIPVHKKRIKAVWLKLALYYPTLVKSLKK